jgi:magnesium-transporting ATPase (P-type)
VTADAPSIGEPSAAVGLTSLEASERLRRDGPNVLPPPPRRSPWWQLLGQMVSFFALMLWVASGLAVLAGLPELGVAIVLVVIVNGVFAFAQEYRAERAAEKLRDLLPRRTTVIRDGVPETIDASHVVVGDLVVLVGGDGVSADVELVDGSGVLVDTSTLTGESAPVGRERGDLLFTGSLVVQGEAQARVVATGAATRLAGIAVMTQRSHRPDTPLTLELHRLVRTISMIAVVVGGTFFILAWAIGMPASDGFVFAIGVTVALVPEGLLPTVTLSLAIGAQRMARRNALVRRLEAVETLGSTTFICTDKTGTLTQNRMNVVEVWTPSGTARICGVGYEPTASLDLDEGTDAEQLRRVAIVARRTSSGSARLVDGAWVPNGDPMEAAIDALVRRLGIDPAGIGADDPTVRAFAFDPHRRTAVLLSEHRLLVKGASDAVLPRCVGDLHAAGAAVASLTGRGLRVLAVAGRARCAGAADRHAGDVVDRELELYGLLGLEDPPRAEAREAIAQCRRAHVKLAMVTGDHPRTAMAIADQVGLRPPNGLVLLGDELPDDEEVLGARIDRDGVVIARVAPEDKLRIARALQARGHVVAMTGDGVNDGPALREADIGVAMGASGTDVAREAADLVLLDDDFATIVAAVELGRATFLNTRRFLTYHLTDNVAELTPFVVWALSGDRFPLALGVLQILALDIGTDTLPAAALGAEEPEERVLDRPPVAGRLLDRTVAWRAFGVLGPTEALLSMTAFVVGLVAAGWQPGDVFPTGSELAAASGAAFLAVVIGQCANAFACRSGDRPVWRMRWNGNRYLVVAVTIELLLAAAFVGVPALADLLEHQAPPAASWIVVGAAAVAVIAVDAAWKRSRRAAGERG